MIRFLIVVTLVLNILTSNNALALQNQILIKVGNEIITSLDIQEEYRYLISLNSELENIEEEQIIKIAKNSLIREKIKRKEILNYVEKIEIEKKFLDPLIKNVYLRLDMKSLDELKAHLKNYNIDFNNFKEKIINIEKEVEEIANAKRNEQLNQFSNIYYKKVEKEFIINEL